MIFSMTGYGRGTATTGLMKITVDLKSLNSKQLDMSMRVPTIFRENELEIRNLLALELERGKIDMIVTVEMADSEPTMKINLPLLSTYKEQIKAMQIHLGLEAPNDWYSLLLRLPDAYKTEAKFISEEEIRAFRNAVRDAVTALKEFRAEEGKKLYDFFVKRIDNIRHLLTTVEPYEKSRIEKIRRRLEDNLSRLTSIEYDKGRLEQELIYYIEKLDISEEKQRLTSHLDYFLKTLDGEENEHTTGQGEGKKLGFISQEMGREINTLGSKSNEAEMQKIVVRMKDELEQIKEQVLNVL